MEISPELRMTAAYSPAFDDFLEAVGVLGAFHRIHKRRHLPGRDVEHEVRVAAEHTRVNRQGVEPRLIAQ
ncbi:hypothetical protein D1872_348030 [compost metagenome]